MRPYASYCSLLNRGFPRSGLHRLQYEEGLEIIQRINLLLQETASSYGAVYLLQPQFGLDRVFQVQEIVD